MRIVLGVIGSLVILAGCIGDEDEAAQGSTTCDPAAFAFLVGQDKGALTGVTVPEVVRVMGETAAATTDYQENRLNVVHDADGKIIKVSCG